MAVNDPTDLRGSERRLFAAVAVFFVAAVLAGFGRTYYLKFAFGTPPLPGLLVHAHGILMTAWIVFFIAQVWLIRSKRHAVHMRNGMIGAALAVAMIVVGFFTAVAAAKNGAAAAPPDIPPLSFMAVPMFDLVLFALFFGAAIYYRKQPANHKRLLLLTVLNFLPPAIARIPIASLQAYGPLYFFGVPTVLAIGLLIYDTWRNGRLNKVFLAGSVILIASYPLRIMLSATEAWTAFAAWLTPWAA
jgi:hypothetical protein